MGYQTLNSPNCYKPQVQPKLVWQNRIKDLNTQLQHLTIIACSMLALHNRREEAYILTTN